MDVNEMIGSALVENNQGWSEELDAAMAKYLSEKLEGNDIPALETNILKAILKRALDGDIPAMEWLDHHGYISMPVVK